MVPVSVTIWSLLTMWTLIPAVHLDEEGEIAFYTLDLNHVDVHIENFCKVIQP